MQAAVIQRQYDDVIAEHYDLDPQNVTGNSLDQAVEHLRSEGLLDRSAQAGPLEVLDLGMGTGLFLEKLIGQVYGSVRPFGVDLSPRMTEIAQARIPGLEAQVDDAANFDAHFADETFDLVCTHFITGFVPVEELAPRIMKRLKPGGYWSFVGSSKIAYPALRKKASSALVRMVFGGAKLDLSGMLCPDDEPALQGILADNGFEVVHTNTFEPELQFPNMDEFMEYAYTGGWLTPFVEDLGVQHAGRATRALLNKLVFPLTDHHNILMAVGRKPFDADRD